MTGEASSFAFVIQNHYYCTPLMTVRKGQWKYYFKTIYGQYTPNLKIEKPAVPELYNVETDISESFNRATDNPAIVEQLIQLGEQHRQEMVIKPSVCDLRN